MAIVHGFDQPERFVAGTVGEPGSRAFFLQVRDAGRLLTVGAEKQQVDVLADRVDELLDEVMAAAGSVVPALAPFDLEDNDPLDLPFDEEFRAGTMTLSWDPDDELVVIEVYPIDADLADVPDDLADPEDPDFPADEMLLVRMRPGYARAFVERARRVIGAGRPTCPFCGGAIDPDGHLCVRANGFKRRDPE
jgi:uncharacterized repeat protein (TIGR03847 family)